MSIFRNLFARRRRSFALGLVGMVVGLIGSVRVASGQDGPRGLIPLDDAATRVELAPPMGELQRLTHKLSLAIGGEDLELAQFYAYESLELLREIQREIPEYDGHPIALLIDRMAMPAFDNLTRTLSAESQAEAAPDRPGAPDSSTAPSRASLDEIGRAVSGVVAACNDCHRVTRHGFIRITDERQRNPFNQSFERR